MIEARVRWGIVGCGDVTEVKSGPGFQKAERSSLVAVMRRNAAAAADYAARHNVPRWYSDADALIRDPEVDAVYIATPPGSHLEIALWACAVGKPAYVEKPMARNATECRQMIQAFASAGLPLFTAYYRRALPRFVAARDLVISGRLGKITSVVCAYAHPSHREMNRTEHWHVQAPLSGGGLFMDLACHTLDILDFVLGPIQDVEGSAANLASDYDVEDNVVMHWRFGSGATGIASWDFAAAVHQDTMAINGTEGRLLMATFAVVPWQLETAAGIEVIDIPNPPHIQQPLIQTIVDELLGNGRCPSHGDSALRTAVVMDKVLETYYNGRSDAFWERPERWGKRLRSQPY